MEGLMFSSIHVPFFGRLPPTESVYLVKTQAGLMNQDDLNQDD